MAGLLEEFGLRFPPTDSSGAPNGVVESAPMGLTTEVKKLITRLGGATVLAGGVSGAWAGIADNIPLAIALVTAVAVIVSAVAACLAKVVHGDVQARATATVPVIEARGLAAKAALETGTLHATAAGGVSEHDIADGLRLALAATSTIHVSTLDGTAEVEGVHWSETEGPRLRLAGGDIIGLDEVRSFYTTSRLGGRLPD